MTRKRYEVRGMMEWHPEFRAGRTRLQVSFTGGHLCGGACTPATFETSDPVVQKVIESSAAFRSKKITLGAVAEEGEVGDGRLGNRSPIGSSTNTPIMTTTFEYSDEEAIYDFLHYQKGVPVEIMNEKGACFREAERLGIKLVKKQKTAGR